MIYLDYAASSPPRPEVLTHIHTVAAEAFGNPGALHSAGAQARKLLQNSRFVLAQLLNVRPEEVFFTSGGTESNNWAIAIGSAVPGKRHILCAASEHSSVLEPLHRLQKKGYFVTYLNPDRHGRISPEAVEAAIRPDTALLCVQAVNNETGAVQDVDALSRIARAHRVLYFCDAVQSFGHVQQNLHKADLISLSAHKLGGPRGTGCLVIRQPLVANPMILGGGQEFGYRSGTENVPGIAGFAQAAQLSRQDYPEDPLALRQLLEQLLRRQCPGVEIAGEQAPRTAISCCAFPGITAEEMVLRLDLKGICASPGAACAAGNGQPSHVLRSMGYSPEEAVRFVRFSLGPGTSSNEIHTTAAVIADICNKRR